MHPRTFLTTQIRNILRKVQQNLESTVFSLTSRKIEIATFVCEPNLHGHLAECDLVKLCLKTADHKVLNEEGESRNNHQYAVTEQDLATRWFNLIRAKQNLHMRRIKPIEILGIVASTESCFFRHLGGILETM